MRAPIDTIAAPLFPTKLPWVNTNGARASILKRGQPMLVEFWDFCRPHSIRTLPYLKEWHSRYAAEGLRVVGVHCPGFAPGRDEQAVRDAVERLEIAHPVLIDSEFEVWREYENRGWPARYLFDGHARLFEYHYGEGAYLETELAIQELLGLEREPMAPLRSEDAPDARLARQSQERPGAWSGSYEAGGVWAVFAPSEAYPESTRQADGGTVSVRSTIGDDTVSIKSTSRDDTVSVRSTGGEDTDTGSDALSQERTLTIEHPGAYQLVKHAGHTKAILDLDVGHGVECFATCFTPGVAP